MEVKINNKKYSFENEITVSQMLQDLKLSEKPCAVEVNKRLVSSSKHQDYFLEEGDEIEIVTLVGGG